MEFNTYRFLLLFLPLALLLFWSVRGFHARLLVLTIASYVFYFYWDFTSGLKGGFTALMIASTSINFFAGNRIATLDASQHHRRKTLMLVPVCINIALLSWFKYVTFGWSIFDDIRLAMGGHASHVPRIILPIGISFFTFEAISYVVDIYRNVTAPAKSYLEYLCFISMFPRQIAGPIVRYSDLAQQFSEKRANGWRADWPGINSGLLLLTMGMAKKVLIADRIAAAINPLWLKFHAGQLLGAESMWGIVLGYAFQIYFDFSGYSDMATGLAHLFAIKLPQNFDSPYKAIDASDFWRRWHITLSSWLRDYVYIPLGGNRTDHRTRNLLITMLLAGLWHGPAWHFVLWGGWWGVLLIAYHTAREKKFVSPDVNFVLRFLQRQLMFFLALLGWVLFRSANLHDAGRAYAALIGGGTGRIADDLQTWFYLGMLACWIWCNVMPNSFSLAYGSKPRAGYALLAGAILATCVFCFGNKSDFIYFQF